METSHIGYNNIYEVIFAYSYTWILIFVQAKYLYDASIPMRENVKTYRSNGIFLPKRWFGMNIDLSDWQWITFDYHFKTQIIFAICYVIVMQIYKHFIKWVFRKKLHVFDDRKRSENLSKIIKNITDLYLIVNFVFCFYMHGTSTIFMLFIMLISYFISIKTYKYKYSNLIAWIWNLFIGIIISKYDHSYFAFSFILNRPSLSWFDYWINVKMRWNQTYRLTMLRCISFHMDLRNKYLNLKLYKCPFNNDKYKDYVDDNLTDFSIVNYFAYCLYTPLLISGPIISFYDWINQLKCNLSYDDKLFPNKIKSPFYNKELSVKYIFIYLIRFLFCYFFFQIWLHFIWTSAFIKYGFPDHLKIENLETISDYKTYVIVLCSFGFLHLAFIWMKFLVIWRFARMWCLFDSIVPIENMQSCYAATTQINQFWKYWHSSFYLWNKRYIYIPLGGSKPKYKYLKYINIIIVFGFTALWHGDWGASLLVWGCLMSLGMIPEILINKWYWNTNLSIIINIRNNSYLNRYIHAFFGGINDIILISANMIGYGPGFWPIIDIWKILLSSISGWYTLLWAISWTFCANIMIIQMKYMQSQKTFASISIIDIDRNQNVKKQIIKQNVKKTQ